jgi:hypothetical protein
MKPVLVNLRSKLHRFITAHNFPHCTETVYLKSLYFLYWIGPTFFCRDSPQYSQSSPHLTLQRLSQYFLQLLPQKHFFSNSKKWRHDTRAKDIQHNDIQHNDSQNNDTQYNDTQQNI